VERYAPVLLRRRPRRADLLLLAIGYGLGRFVAQIDGLP